MIIKRILAVLVVVAAASSCAQARATTVNVNYAGRSGYTAIGSFTYDSATAPTVITEANGAAPTSVIQSFTISFYSPINTLLETGSAVVNGVSSDRFFRLTYNTSTNLITTLDADIGGSYQYFLTNLRTPTGMVVGAGVTGFNFFNRATANTALDTATTVTTTVASTVAAVPEPAGWTVLPIAALGLLALRRRRV